MLPAAPLALLALAGLLPGWLFLRLAERRGPRRDQSGLTELVELAAVGFSAVAVSCLVVAGLSWTGLPGLFDVSSWASVRHAYLGDHIGAAIVSASLVPLFSCLLVLVLFLVLYRKKPADFHPGSSVWYDALGRRPKGKQCWVGVHRTDGSLVEGLLLSYPTDADENTREIALYGPPIRVTPAGAAGTDLPLNRVVVPESQILALTVVLVPIPDQPLAK